MGKEILKVWWLTHQEQRDVAPTCFYQGFPGS